MAKRVVVFKDKPKTYSSGSDKRIVYYEAVNFSNLPINNCVKCKAARPRLRKMVVRNGSTRWFVECPSCKTTGVVCKYPWKAVLMWNKSPNSIVPHYTDFWMFHLDKFKSPVETHAWLCIVKQVLERRLADARKDSKSGKGYKKRLNGYLLLCDNAIASCKFYSKVLGDETDNETNRKKEQLQDEQQRSKGTKTTG